MARMMCKCGKQLSNQESPNDIELIIYTDKEWDFICSKDLIETWKIPSPSFDAWKCPICGRVYLFQRGKNEPFCVYKMEIE